MPLGGLELLLFTFSRWAIAPIFVFVHCLARGVNSGCDMIEIKSVFQAVALVLSHTLD